MNAGEILHHVTVCGKAEDVVQTVGGNLSYLEWLRRERDRIRARTGWPVDVWTNPVTGEISLVLFRTTKT